MASRQQEKERRRQERLAAEQAAQRSQDGRKRAGLALGALVALAVLVLAGIYAFGGEDRTGATTGANPPPQRISDLAAAAKAAGCEVRKFPIEGRTHITNPATVVKYRTNPPTSGDHSPTWAQDGIYNPDNPPDLKMGVHTLEHGRIDFQYAPGTPQRRIQQLELMFNEEVDGKPGYRSLLFQNQTRMPYAVAATAWGRSVTCKTFNDRVFDALRAFRRDFQGKGPEFFP